MLLCKLHTQNYKHEYFFEFRGKKYLVHSIVRLTKDGQKYLGSKERDVILIEQFYNWNKKCCWKYKFRSIDSAGNITDYSTDRTPDELIEKVVVPANSEYVSREIFGTESPVYTSGVKHQKKDWEIPEVLAGWIVYILICFIAMFFNGWYMKLIIIGVSGWIFGLYRQAYINAHTTYIHDSDTEILKKKHETLYGIRSSKGGDNK